MTIGKKLFIIFSLLFSFFITNLTYAVETNEEFAIEKPSVKIHKKSGQSKNMAQDFIRKTKKWKIGSNTRSEDNGGDFFVSIGISNIAFDDNFNKFGDARQDAFDIAFLESKKQFIKFMGQQISTNIINERKQGSYAQPPEPGTSEMEDLMNEISSFEEGKKLRTLINLKLDQALKEAGYEDPTTPEAAEEAEKIVKTKEFSKSIEAAAEHRIAGFQTYKIFEISDGNKGDISVIGLWSKKLNLLADALSTGGDIPAGTPKKALMDQIPSLEKLAFSFGARMTTDENGNPSIMSFGHASPLFDDPDEWSSACNQAQLQAESFISIFANEIASYKENLNKSQNTKIFEDNASLNDLKSETKSIKNHYKRLETSGYIDTAGSNLIDSVEIQHPANEQALECIATVVWNTKERSTGENFKNTNKAAEKITLDSEQESNDTNEEGEQDQEEADEDGTSYSGESDEADDDF
ncbi:hypothetical protein OAU87_03090 [Alphaproteobacteria bacterium]|nr:hypothetical protein [Alphaproteobacteria bacterium]MDC3270200.1 hypothetical protein [Alphaproteobacteria bacterium]